MKTLLPKALRAGDTIGLISPSSHCAYPDKINQAVRYLEAHGYRVKASRYLNCIDTDPAIADRQKLHDIHAMFSDPAVHAIVCLRGGAGATRLLGQLDYGLIAANPKIVVGYSDITALSLAMLAKVGLITFSGPMLATELYEPDPYTEEHFWGMLTSPAYSRSLINYEHHPITCLQSGTVEGRLLGGNLSVVTSLLGTPYFPHIEGEALLFFEDVNEPVYRIDRMLSHVGNAGLLTQAKGLLFGYFSTGTPLPVAEEQRLQYSMEYYSAMLPPDAVAIRGLSFGHIRHMMTMPVGARCKLHVAADGLFSFGTLEAVVRA
uniref:Muramoyltetrapeptide carboxypeptidase, putative n=1 Tax=Chlorobium chlorochromatii (strain CaD3) TaxID=340177 RepID=Q3AP11_CHLCH